MSLKEEITLKYKFPKIAAEWHPTLNAPLTPETVTNRSNKKVWWQCSNNSNHIWDSVVGERTRLDKRRSKGCKICNKKPFRNPSIL